MTDDIVDEAFDTAGPALAAVRWYTTESPCTGVLCTAQMHTEGGPDDPLDHRFTGVADANHFFAAGQTIERWHLQVLRDRLR